VAIVATLVGADKLAAWYFGPALVGILVVLAMLGYGFRTALGPSLR